MIRLLQVVRSYEVEPIELGDGESLKLRIEVLKAGPRRFLAKVWRLETYRLQPTFPQLKRQPPESMADVEVLLREEHLSLEPSFRSAEKALEATTHHLERQLFPSVAKPFERQDRRAKQTTTKRSRNGTHIKDYGR